MRRFTPIFGAAILLVAMTALADAPHSPVSPELRERAIQTLREVMRSGKHFANVHAAEMLLALDYPDQVRETFEQDVARQKVGSSEYITTCRVLAQAANRPGEREHWVAKLVAVFLDETNPKQRGAAAESLGKIGYDPPADIRSRFEAAGQSADEVLAVFARWVLANSGSEADERLLADSLRSPEPQARANAANALRLRRRIASDVYKRLALAASAEPLKSGARVYLISAAFVHARSDAERRTYGPMLLAYAKSGSADEKHEALQAFARRGAVSQLPLLEALLVDAEPDVRCGAAGAILRTERRSHSALGLLDWVVIAGYGLGMLTIGYFYSRRSNTSEEYLLGGRRMNSWAVGLSLFATLLSTISYLAYPGEMIMYGPMILAGYLATPFIYLVAGWFLIPYIMRLKVTSAYEILELRLGLSVRLLAATLFLAMRLFWMAVIIYTTTNTVLIPLMGVDPKYSPLVAAMLGAITLIYTSMGGIRAVIVTDVVQTFILFAAAILSLILITFAVGGFSSWFPTAWDPAWSPPRIWFDSTSRITFAGAVMSGFLWWICTTGSDQMAIQRYLSTRDARAARKTLAVSLASDCVITLFLSTLGFALLAYFRLRPHLLADGQSLSANADQLFPRYIAVGLPMGLSGLAVAGLLAAGMSSLSSGINSSSTVIKVDFLDRFRRSALRSDRDVHRARVISVVIGILVVLGSALVDRVSGNLLEAISKLMGLFVAPLFLLFCMAMFIPWATSPGTIVGMLAAITVAIEIGFFGIFGLSFIWIMPCALGVGLLVAALASLVPIGRRSGRIRTTEPLAEEQSQ